MADTIRVTRQEIVNLYRAAKSQAVQLERLLVQFDLTTDDEERTTVTQIRIHST